MVVYKDECVYTCDNTFSPHGIDVCLQCFIGTSPDPSHDFTKAHSRLTTHTAFLNIHRVPKPKPAESDPTQEPEPKRLHIHEDSGEADYTESTTFKTLGSDTQSEFEEQISTVLNSDSYAKAKQTEEWELELEPCEHVAILESTLDTTKHERMTAEQLSHCSQCELSSNLWLCLKCGHLGCGRRQFDGSGGNGHALEHFEQHGEPHALAVKLGSITPEGHVDVYCYACNDDKLDPNVASHLAYWGIDIAKQTKTEKSMTELQLEQNMNWDFNSTDGGEPVHGPGFTGMKNLGNSCYMNSVVQSLFHIPEFSRAFPANDPSSPNLGGPEDLATQLNKIQDGLDSGRYEVISPQMLKSLVGANHPEFATGRQQDAFEYFTHILSLVSKLSTPARDVPARLFGFRSERRILCKQCGVVRYIDEDQENLSISVPIEENENGGFRPVSFKELLDLYTSDEELESTCPRCQGSQAITSIKFKTFPKVFVVNVRRFRIKNWVPQKVDVPVTVPDDMSLDKYLSPGPQEHEDVLSAEEAAKIDEADKYTPNEESVVMLTSMGFDNDLSVAGLKLAHERSMPEHDLEAVVDLIVSGDAAEYHSKAQQEGPIGADPESVAMLESMGFDTQQAKLSLKHNSGNVEAAVEWLFAGKYEEALAEEEQGSSAPIEPIELGDNSLPAKYELTSTICHKGASVHVGHYVAAIRANNESYLFNDERVTKGSDADELQKFAYIYLFHRV